MSSPRPTAPGSKPLLLAVLLCEAIAVERTRQKTSLLGLCDRVWAPEFPVQLPLSLYCRLVGAQGAIQIEVRFVERDTDTLHAAFARTFTAPDRLEAAEVLFDLPPLVFPRPGRYEFQVAADGAFLGATFMDAVLIAAPTR
jgi:hypothetical protein